jgi:membrane-bound ClpP family serine protease
MEQSGREFKPEEENAQEIKNFAKNSRVCLLSMIAPFVPERVAPGQVAYAEFRYPEEFIIEDFAALAQEKFPEKKERPPLYLLIHSPGGYVNSAYIIASVLRETFNSIIAFVPHIAASAATLLAISCNEIVMGDISQLSPIDPYYREDDKVIFATSVLNAFRNLDDYFKTRKVEEASYPYKHFADMLTPEDFDRAVRMISMVERYASELLQKAGYKDEEITRIVEELVQRATLHEEIIRYNRAKEIGLKVKYHREHKEYTEAWLIMRKWLKMYYQQPSLIHIIKYALPE